MSSISIVQQALFPLGQLPLSSHPTSHWPSLSPYLCKPYFQSEEVASLPAEEPEPKVETTDSTTTAADVAVPEKQDKEEEKVEEADELAEPSKGADIEPTEADVKPTEKENKKKEGDEEEEYVDYEEEGGSEGESEGESEDDGEKSDEESPTHIPRRGRFYQHDDRNYVDTSSAPPTG